jgi:serine O-acetyltransferase
MTMQDKLAARLQGRAGGLTYTALKLLGVEIPRRVVIGANLRLPHGAVGLVVHEKTVIGDNVTLYGGVTIGRADTLNLADPKLDSPDLVNVVIEDDVIVGAGAKVLFRSDRGGSIRLGKGCMIAANAVVLQDVPAGEIWGGIPAKRIG